MAAHSQGGLPSSARGAGRVLSRRQVWGYAGYAFPLTALYILMHVHLPKFYSDDVGVGLGLLGSVLMLGRIYNAVIDPFLGLLSDRCRHRWGRRRFFLLAFTLPFALSMLALFFPPLQAGALSDVWFVVGVFAAFTLWSLLAVPYDALGVEITHDYDERTRVLGLRDGLALSGMVAAAGTVPFIGWLLGSAGTPEARRLQLSLYVALYGAMMCALGVACVRLARERRAPPGPRADWRASRRLLENRPFWLLLLASTLSGIGASIPATLLLFFVEYVVQSAYGELFLLLYVLIGVFSLPLWLRLAQRFEKRSAWVAALLTAALSYLASYVLEPRDEAAFALVLVLSGLPLGALIALPAAMEADVVDYGAAQTGVRQEGLYLGVWSVSRELAAAGAVGLTLGWLERAGYAPNQQQTPQVLWTLRTSYGLLPAACFVAAGLLMLGYPLDRARHRQLAPAAPRSGAEPGLSQDLPAAP